MGFMKRLLDEQNAMEQWALDFLCEVGTLNRCDIHGVYYEGRNDIETAYRAFNDRVTTGRVVLQKGQTRSQRTDALKAAYDVYGALEACQAEGCLGWSDDD